MISLEKHNESKQHPAKKSDTKAETIKNQQNESYQDGVLADKLNNNKDIYTFNNRNK